MDDLSPLPTLYLTEQLPLPPLTAQAAFDAAHRDLSTVPGGLRWTVTAGVSRLVLVGVEDGPRVCDLSPFRTAAGRLHGGRWRRGWPVEVELTPWSRTSTALGLRPTRTRLARSSPSPVERYVSSGMAALGVLADRLLAVVETGLARELATVVVHPSLAGPSRHR